MDEKNELALKLLRLAQDTITVRFRFLDTALAKINTELKSGIHGVAVCDDTMYFDPGFLLKAYLDEPQIAVRAYLHMLFHCIFVHQYKYQKVNKRYWDLATDIAVESIILEMDFKNASLSRDDKAKDKLNVLKKRVPKLTAEKLYKEFLVNNPSEEYEQELRELFTIDFHRYWEKQEAEEIIVSEADWKKIVERIKTELNAFSKKNHSGEENLLDNLNEASRKRYNYKQILERFMVMGEEITVNDDEFDYIYYTYGLNTYGNIPLIEPLEYKETRRIKEFVIAIDTSASCRGDIVREFVKRTYDILKQSENFFSQINIHIIQCDSEIKSRAVIRNEEDFKNYIRTCSISGSGSTDFRPVFSYVDTEIAKGTFENLKGIIYFTDGYGIYPERMPGYDVIFAFLNYDEARPKVPGWAVEVVMEDELNEY